ncbi:MAG: FHA domain-containing protein [Thermoleophilaceae bacterium]
MRASDDTRERAANRLREGCVDGRISIDTLSARLDRLFAARDRGEVEAVVADLPRRRSLASLFRRAERLVPPLVRDGEALTIGRGTDCALPLEDPFVSRRHAQLSRSADTWLLRDLGSTNGVWVNGWRVREAELRDGDEVRLGSMRFRFAPGSR